MKVMFSSKFTDRWSWVLLMSRCDTVGFPHAINYVFPYLQVKSICQNILLFPVSCILITPVFRALSFLDGIFCRFFVRSSFTSFIFVLWRNYAPQLARATTAGKFKQECKLKKPNWLYSNKGLSSWLQPWKHLQAQQKIPKYLRNLQWL